jgi:hypothetical protein
MEKSLKRGQSAFQRSVRNDLHADMALKIQEERMVVMGRLPKQQDCGALMASMMEAMLEGTWHVFQRSIGGWLKLNDKSFSDFDDLNTPSSLINILVNNKTNPNREADGHLHVQWVGWMARALLDTGGFTIADVSRLELLAHILVIFHSPVRPQSLFDNKASLVYAVKMQNGQPRICQVRGASVHTETLTLSLLMCLL